MKQTITMKQTVTLLASLLLMSLAGVNADEPKSPNILLVMADDLGWVKPEEKLSRGFYSPLWHHGFEESFATTSAVPTWNPTVTPAGKISGEDGKKDEASHEGAPWKGGKPYVHNEVEVSDNMDGDDSRVIMDRVIPFIRGAAEKAQPFLACVWFHTPHEPVVADPEYRKLYAKNGSAKQNYFGAITAMDEQIGRLRDELRKLNIDKNTVIFFTSDNGPSDPLAKKGIASAETAPITNTKIE